MLTLSIGFGNFYGGYTPKDKGWAERIAKVAALVHTMSVSVMATVELHEEHGMAAEFSKHVPWLRLAIGDGGNQLLYDPKKHHVDSRYNWMLPHNRAASIWRITHLTSKTEYHIALTHLIASPGTPAQREDQMRDWINHIQKINAPVIACGDFNSYTLTGNAPQAQLHRAGYREIRDQALQPVTRGNWDSHKDNGHQQIRAGRGHWIDNIYTNRYLTCDSGALVPTHDLSDHNFLQASISHKLVA